MYLQDDCGSTRMYASNAWDPLASVEPAPARCRRTHTERTERELAPTVKKTLGKTPEVEVKSMLLF